MAEDAAEGQGGTDGGRSGGRRVGRRAFLGLLAAGAAALVIDRAFFAGHGGGEAGRDFPVRSVANGPEFDPQTWRLKVDGLVRKPITLTFGELEALPSMQEVRDFRCVEGWGVPGVAWTGVGLRELVGRADLDPKATHLVFTSGDGTYTDGLTLEEAFRPDVLLAYRLDGEPLPAEHGAPLRLVVPGSYGYKYVKWVVRVTATAKEHVGYWEERGYSVNGAIR